MTWYFSRLSGASNPPFSLEVESWTEKAPSSLGDAHYNAMMANLATLSAEVQDDFSAGNKGEHAAQRGIMTAQGPDFDVINSGETGDGFGYGATLTTSAAMLMPDMDEANYDAWWPQPYRGWTIGVDESVASGDHTAPHEVKDPPGGRDSNAIVFSKTAWDAARTDLEEWINDIANFATFLGTDRALGFATLESYLENKGLFWNSNPPFLSPARGTNYNNDDCYWTYDPTGDELKVYWANAVGLDVTANQNEYEFFIMWKPLSGDHYETIAGSRSQAFSANSGNVTYSTTNFQSSTTEDGAVILCIKRKADGKLCQAIPMRGIAPAP